ncbi:MAG: peptidase, partial [Verrucomicrobiaceae bacterium]|nr:peptidase [Verrucomicrobiaceae bacterium]
MSILAPTFDESWHRVAPRCIRLRPGVEMFAQQFRGQRWYVVRDAMSGKFFRIRPAAYQFICELERGATVGDAWDRRLGIDAENVPGQGEVVRLLSQLHRAGLIRSDVEGDVDPLARAFVAERHQEAVQRWSSILFFRQALWNPDAFLRKTLPAVRWIISWAGLLAWVALLAIGISQVIENWTAFSADGNGLLGAKNLAWMYLVMIVVKAAHEMGHGYVCRRFGGEVPEMGVMLLMFNPLPYVDASSATALRSKWKRITVGGAGMVVELAIAAIAAIIWAHTGTGMVHALAYNAVVAASVVTLLFNANPLLRYDGYHMLSDWLEVPNLQGRSSEQALYLLERWGFGLKRASSPGETRTESLWLTTYFIASWFYRLVMMIGILLVVSQHYMVLGVILAVLFGFMWVLLPVFKSVGYLLNSPRLATCRPRAIGVTFVLVGGALFFLCLIPMPYHFRADGVIRADPFSRVYTGADGQLVKLLVQSGRFVVKGQPLAELVNEELGHEFAQLAGEQALANARARLSLDENPSHYASMKTYFQALAVRRAKLEDERAALIVRAPCEGRWLAPDAPIMTGAVLPKGMELGAVEGNRSFYISAVVQQDDVSRLFTSKQVTDTEVKVHGQENQTLGVTDFIAIPAEREALPSAALGILGG